MIVKVCLDCGEEYRPDILTCADCGGELEPRDDEARASWSAPGGEPRGEPDDRPPGDYLPVSWSAYASELTPLADRLVACAIPFYLRPRLAEGGAPSGYEIRVRQEERERALREVAALRRDGALAPGEGLAPPAPAGEADDAGRPTSCPACGAGLSEHAAECPDCGLAFDGEVGE